MSFHPFLTALSPHSKTPLHGLKSCLLLACITNHYTLLSSFDPCIFSSAYVTRKPISHGHVENFNTGIIKYKLNLMPSSILHGNIDARSLPEVSLSDMFLNSSTGVINNLTAFPCTLVTYCSLWLVVISCLQIQAMDVNTKIIICP